MAHITRRTAKIIGIIVGIIVALMILVIVFISPIAKYLALKYGKKYLGREITIAWVYVNPFTGFVHIHDLKIFEAGSKETVFFSFKGLSVNYNILKTLKKTYEVESITLSEPYARIVQDHKKMNFDDIIARLTPKDTVKKEPSPPVHFNILDVEVKDGEFHYEESTIPINYYVKKVNISSPGMRWNVDTVAAKFAVTSGPSTGDVNGHATFNLKSMEYKAGVQLRKFDLHFIEQYIHDFANYGSFYANVDGDINAAGNAGSQLAVDANGWIAVNDFHFGKEVGEDYVAFKKLQIAMIDANPRKFSYYLDSIMIQKPYFKYERYDRMDNITALFGKDMQNIKDTKADSSRFNLVIEIGKTVNELIKNFMQSYFKINRVAIYNGDIHFNDFSNREKFAISADPLFVAADTIDKNRKRFKLFMNTGIKPYGDIGISLSADPNNFSTFDIDYKIEKLPISLFNPYVLSFTTFPLDRGSLDFNGYLHVLDSNINGDNHLLILDPRVGKRLKKHEDTHWLPVPLIMSIVRSRGGVIDFEVPIKGSLSDPKFKLKDVILDIVGNIFIKPPSSAYLFHVKEVESKVEKFLTLKWETNQIHLRPRQEKFVEQIAKFLDKTPDASISVSPMEYTEKEKEYLLFFEAKKKYWTRDRANKSISEDDSIGIERMSVKDSTFVHYLNKLIGDTPMFTIQEKCQYYAGEARVNARYAQLLKDRHNTFVSYFPDNVKSRIKMQTAQAVIPFNGFSYYKIEYKGELPEKLQKAYDAIYEDNMENPRQPYLKDREKNGGVVTEAEIPTKGRRHKKK